MKIINKAVAIAFFATIMTGCSFKEDDVASLLIFSETFDFNESQHRWIAGFADYPAGPDDSIRFELQAAYTDAPAGVLAKKSILLSGNNLNGDLFMYLKRKVSGLAPNTEYTITFNVELASNLNSFTDYASGAVYLKAGAAHLEPKTVIEAGKFVLNIDKGNGAQAGEDMILLGDIRTPAEMTGYVMISRNNTMANSRYVAKSNSNGELWLIVGTDSTLEGITTVLYSKVSVVFSAS